MYPLGARGHTSSFEKINFKIIYKLEEMKVISYIYKIYKRKLTGSPTYCCDLQKNGGMKFLGFFSLKT